MTKPVTSMCIYQIRSGSEQDFEGLLADHWPTLRKHDLVPDESSQIFRGRNDDDTPFFVEILTWCDESCPDSAHECPEVMAIWESMGKHCESRNGKPAMEFPRVEKIS